MSDEKGKNWEVGDLLEQVGTVTKYGTLLVGGLCLLMYSNEIGQFPEGMGLGEGLAFYLVCAGFLFVYLMYMGICTATGCLLLAWPAKWINRLLMRRESLGRKPMGQVLLHTDFSSMRDVPVVAMGIVGLACHALFVAYSKEPIKAAVFLAVPLIQGLGVILLLVVTRRQKHLESGVLVGEFHQAPASVDEKRRTAVIARRFFYVWLVVAPMILLPERAFLVDAAFRLAQLRKDGATVHVKAPWSERVARSTLEKSASFLGNDYVEFKRVNVLLRSVGQKVVLELPSATGTTRLPIPTEAIYVE